MKAMVGLIIGILIIFGVRLFWPTDQSAVRDVSQSEVMNENANKEVTIEEESSFLAQELITPSDERTRLMTAEYEILEQERKNLKRQLARLRHDMWGVKFAKDKAKKMSATVMSAANVLRNPDMLGAFSDVDAIKDEITKINFAEKSLQEISDVMKAMKNSSKESEQI
jgi:cell shape-determining protein MreC